MKILSRNPHENEEIGQYRERFGKEIFQSTIVFKDERLQSIYEQGEEDSWRRGVKSYWSLSHPLLDIVPSLT